MDDFFIIFIPLAIIVILLYMAFQYWQNKQVELSMRELFPKSDKDPLLAEKINDAGLSQTRYQEPTLNSAFKPEATIATIQTELAEAKELARFDEPEDLDELEEPEELENLEESDVDLIQENLEQAAPTFVATPTPAPVQLDLSLPEDSSDYVDEFSESVIDVAFDNPVSGAKLVPELDRIKQSINRPVRFLLQSGLLQSQEINQELLYDSVQLAFTLANRSGPINEEELNHIFDQAISLLDLFGGSVDIPNQQKLLEHSAQIDELCASLDQRVSIVLKLENPLDATVVYQSLLDEGFQPYCYTLAYFDQDVSGEVEEESNSLNNPLARFIACADGRALDDIEGKLSSLQFIIDVPLSLTQSTAFTDMYTVVQRLAYKLHGEIFDSSGEIALKQDHLHQFDVAIFDLYQRLQQAQIEPGSNRAQRLFS